MSKRSFTFAAVIIVAATGQSANSPDLFRREVTVVTQNAYPPLQFVDLISEAPVGWKYLLKRDSRDRPAFYSVSRFIGFKPSMENAFERSERQLFSFPTKRDAL